MVVGTYEKVVEECWSDTFVCGDSTFCGMGILQGTLCVIWHAGPPEPLACCGPRCHFADLVKDYLCANIKRATSPCSGEVLLPWSISNRPLSPFTFSCHSFVVCLVFLLWRPQLVLLMIVSWRVRIVHRCPVATAPPSRRGVWRGWTNSSPPCTSRA